MLAWQSMGQWEASLDRAQPIPSRRTNGLNSAPQKTHIHWSLQNVTSVGNRVFGNVISYDEVILGWGGPYIQ